MSKFIGLGIDKVGMFSSFLCEVRFFYCLFKLVFVWVVVSRFLCAEVLELESTQLSGKKDQPSAMTFVSRARQDLPPVRFVWPESESFTEKIFKQFEKAEVFDIKPGTGLINQELTVF